MRLDIPAGTAVRFEPGQTRDVRARFPSPETAHVMASGRR